jgi:hypothetical protein
MGKAKQLSKSENPVCKTRIQCLASMTMAANSLDFTMGLLGAFVRSGVVGTVNTTNARFQLLNDLYEYYKFKSLKYRIHPVGVAVSFFVCPYSNASGASPAGLQVPFEQSSPVFISQTSTVPTQWVDVDCTSPLPWYKTYQDNSGGSDELVQQFFGGAYSTSATPTLYVEFDAIVHFKNPIVGGFNPTARVTRALVPPSSDLGKVPDEDFVRIPRSLLAGSLPALAVSANSNK